MPISLALGQRRPSTTVLLPGPQPRSTIRAGASSSTLAAQVDGGLRTFFREPQIQVAIPARHLAVWSEKKNGSRSFGGGVVGHRRVVEREPRRTRPQTTLYGTGLRGGESGLSAADGGESRLEMSSRRSNERDARSPADRPRIDDGRIRRPESSHGRHLDAEPDDRDSTAVSGGLPKV